MKKIEVVIRKSYGTLLQRGNWEADTFYKSSFYFVLKEKNSNIALYL